MLLSRFWYLFLAATAGTAVAAALLAQGIINGRYDSQLANQLRRDRFELDALLSLEARRRLDKIAFITVDGKLGRVLRKAQGVAPGSKKLWELNKEAKEALNEHVTRLAEAAPGEGSLQEKRARVGPAIGMALDSQGRIIGQLGPLAGNPPGAGLGSFPLVKRALLGFLRDDVWLYDRRVYRMAARPVVYGGHFVGAIVHGYRFDAPFAEELSKSLGGGASIAFFYGTQVLASYSPPELSNAPTREQIAVSLEKALQDPGFKQGKRTEPMELQGGGRAVYSLVTGSAAAALVGYAIARPRQLLTSPKELFTGASDEDVDALPIGKLVAAALGLAALGLLFMFLERDRPLRRVIHKTAEIASDDRDRLVVTEWRGAYRRLADQLNKAIDKKVERAAEMAPTTKKKVNLDEILGPTPEATGGDAFFGFAGDGGDAADKAANGLPSAPGAQAPSSQLSESAGSASPLPNPAPAPGPGAIPPPPRPSARRSPSPPPSTPGASPPPPTSSSDSHNDQDEETHFREVFEQYRQTRKDCGESTEELTFEKFVATLRKNRDQIISKHNASGVRFTVYVKQGKAALKAAPIKKSGA